MPASAMDAAVKPPIGLIDCDIHHEVPSEADLIAYLPAGWQEYVRNRNPLGALREVLVFPPHMFTNPHGSDRLDALKYGRGGPPASSATGVAEHLLDSAGTDYAILTGGTGLYLAGLPNPYFAAEVARALHEHTRDHWLDVDERYRGSIFLANQVPEFAAEEIRRLADDDRFVQAMFCTNAVGRPFGHPIFDPIHRAAAETGRPIAIHSLGEMVSGSAAPQLASGMPSLYAEVHTAAAIQGMLTHLMSFFFHGVFERYPSLKLMMVESGALWIPSALRRLDLNFKGLRMEVPWCKRSPSDLFHTNVRVTTQPWDVDPGDDGFLATFAQYGLDDVLMYSSDYPHWDGDEASAVIRCIPTEWQDKVLWRNAADAYGLQRPAYTAA